MSKDKVYEQKIVKNKCVVNRLHFTQIIHPLIALLLINMIILGTWKKKGIMLVYTACITIIISRACVGCHPLLYWGDVTENT